MSRLNFNGFEEQQQTPIVAGGTEGSRLLSERVKIGEAGRLVIPAAMREALGIKPADTVTLVLENGELRVLTIAAAIKNVQALARKYVVNSLAAEDETDAFLAERRKDQKRADERLDRLHTEGVAAKRKAV